MQLLKRRTRIYAAHFFRHDFKASITVFLVALPLCLGIALASNVPPSAGLIAGIIGGLLVSVLSKSPLSVSGPAAGLTAISVGIITEVGSLQAFFMCITLAGVLQMLIGLGRLTGFTQFIPSAVIKGMLAAIGLLLILKQLPLLIGYDKADFWAKELFNVFSFHNAYEHVQTIYTHLTPGTILLSLVCVLLTIVWEKKWSKRFSFIPVSFVLVLAGSLLAVVMNRWLPQLSLAPSQYVQVPANLAANWQAPDLSVIFHNSLVWKNAVIICIVASLETLLSIEAIDKLDPYNRITPQNREMVAQGTGNLASGLLGGLPITAVIVRSSANAEAGARTRWSGFFHGIWLLLFVLWGTRLLNSIPYCVLAVILIRTGYNLARPSMIKAVYRLGREQFMPFIVTLLAILFTDLLVGVGIGVAYAAYYLFKNTYKAGFTLHQHMEGHIPHYQFDLAINVSFLNKQRLKKQLDRLPTYAVVTIDGTRSVYIDYDVVEIINEFRAKAHQKHIELHLKGVPDVEVISQH